MEELCRLTKTIPKLQAEVSLMMLNKNLLFSTLGSQITNNERALQVDKNPNNLRCND